MNKLWKSLDRQIRLVTKFGMGTGHIVHLATPHTVLPSTIALEN